VLAVQPMLDAVFLSWLGTPEEMGWFAATRKLVGVLAFPASALVVALYPTLCRLRVQSTEAFNATAANAIHLVGVVAVPVALGCGLFPELGVAIFGLDDFAPARDNLRVLAAWLLLLYFTMPIGSTLTASGRQRPWTLALLAGVTTAAVLDPFLISWFHDEVGNGGLGVCVAALVGEVVTLTAASFLLPRGLFASMPRRRILALLAAGAAMAATALATMELNRWIAAALSLVAYGAVLVLAGGRAELARAREFALSLRR
jgi:O-antigen/teichoic acid export membrane protein